MPWWFWWRFSQNQFVLLSLSVVFSPLAVCLGCVLVMVPRTALDALGGGSSQSCLVCFAGCCTLGGDELSLSPVKMSLLQSAWALSVKDREVGLVSRALWALPDGGLVSAMGVCLAMPLVGVLASCLGFLFRVRERPVVCILPLLSMGCSGWQCFHMTFGAMSCSVATFVVKVPPLALF
ncbi:hypothetical protein Taro_036726 [Colocasia esculenta]|uniref:Uncharacterized protein n=1 Tax=Colocasia esculenta TaxID=4460 RepID=A0A843WAN1_COLES|nr:hypothetical protein [Colocasia esculenta]